MKGFVSEVASVDIGNIEIITYVKMILLNGRVETYYINVLYILKMILLNGLSVYVICNRVIYSVSDLHVYNFAASVAPPVEVMWV
jgi:hypothetical protein